MNESVCIFGGSGKIGSMFHNLYKNAFLPKFNSDYTEYFLTENLKKKLKKYRTIVLCHHNIESPWQIYVLTLEILRNINDDHETTIINIASDAEILWIPFRLEYGKMKKRFREELFKRKNRIINIFFPYVSTSNYIDLYTRLAKIDWSYNNYYLSPWSSIVRPCLLRYAHWNEPAIEQICFENNSKLSQVLDDRGTYENMRIILERKLRVQLVPFDNLLFKFVMWKLQFEGYTKAGQWHLDMKRCLFGNSLRTIACIENTSDYKIAVENEVFSMNKNDMLVLPDGVWHQPLPMTHGKRTIIVFDFFTSQLPNIIAIFLFLLFNQLKILGINV
jgi:hypothetical protein